MSYEAMFDQVLLRRLDVDDSKTEGGLYKPEVFQVKSNKGEVISVGSEVPLLVPGDIVLFSQSGADDIELDGKQFILVHHKQIYLRQKLVKIRKAV
jgi:co-chaperonin GroES (HSP10)